MHSYSFAIGIALCCVGFVCQGTIVPADMFNSKWTYNQSYASQHGLLGPDDWKSFWPVCDTSISGAKQSPINIVHTDLPISDAGMLPLTFGTASCDTDIRNIGSTLSATPSDLANCAASFTTVSGTKYKFYEAHLHWHRLHNHRGTEHRVDGQAEAVEAQLIHYNAKFHSIDEAFRDANTGNIAVVAVRYTVAPSGETPTEAPSLDAFIASTYNKIEFMDLSNTSAVSVGKFNPYDLIGTALPRANLPMYHYNGSLTVPSCDSITSWFIVQQTVMLAQSQIQQLRCFKHMDKTTYEEKSLGFDLDDNIRPIVPLNDREVVAYPVIIPPNVSSDSASVSSSGHPFFTPGTIIAITVAGAVVLVGVSVLITALVCKYGSHKNGYEGINSA